jgi:hypothetical protein
MKNLATLAAPFRQFFFSTIVLFFKTYEASDDEQYAPEMSQFSPDHGNGYPVRTDAAGENGDPAADTTDGNGGIPVHGGGPDDIVVHFRPQVWDWKAAYFLFLRNCCLRELWGLLSRVCRLKGYFKHNEH